MTLALHARYRGRATRRSDLVKRSATALETLDGVYPFQQLGVEDIRTTVASATTLCDTIMALLADAEWAIGIGIAPAKQESLEYSTKALSPRARAGIVYALAAPAGDVPLKQAKQEAVDDAANISAVFQMLRYVLAKRTAEGKEATALVRRGLNQNEAAEMLGISKQAMSQRLQAAGWHAEAAGWSLAVNLIAAADARRGSGVF